MINGLSNINDNHDNLIYTIWSDINKTIVIKHHKCKSPKNIKPESKYIESQLVMPNFKNSKLND